MVSPVVMTLCSMTHSSDAAPPAGIPPHQVGAWTGTAVGPIDPVQGGDVPGADLFVGVGAPAGMDIDRVMAQGQLQIVGPGGADGADGARLAGVLIDPQHPGDAALGQALVDDVGVGDPHLGESLPEVVEHDGHRAAVHILLGDGKSREGIHRAGILQLGGRRGNGLGRPGWEGVLRRGRDLGRGLPAGAQAQQQSETEWGELLGRHGRKPLFPGDSGIIL